MKKGSCAAADSSRSRKPPGRASSRRSMQAYATMMTPAVCKHSRNSRQQQHSRHHTQTLARYTCPAQHASACGCTLQVACLRSRCQHTPLPWLQRHATHHHRAKEQSTKPHPGDEEHHAPGVSRQAVELECHKQQADVQQVPHRAKRALSLGLTQGDEERQAPGYPARSSSSTCTES